MTGTEKIGIQIAQIFSFKYAQNTCAFCAKLHCAKKSVKKGQKFFILLTLTEKSFIIYLYNIPAVCVYIINNIKGVTINNIKGVTA